MLDPKGLGTWIMRRTLGSNKHKTILANGYYSNCILNAGILRKNLPIYKPWWMNAHTHTHTLRRCPWGYCSPCPSHQMTKSSSPACISPPFHLFTAHAGDAAQRVTQRVWWQHSVPTNRPAVFPLKSPPKTARWSSSNRHVQSHVLHWCVESSDFSGWMGDGS